MKIEELRIGNFIRYNKIISKITEIRKNNILTIENINGEFSVFVNEIKPLRITIDIVKKTDFKKLKDENRENYYTDWFHNSDGELRLMLQSNNSCINRYGYSLGIESQKNEDDYAGTNFWIYSSTDYSNLHELQNIYFSIKGEELKLR